MSSYVMTTARNGDSNDIGISNRDFAFSEGKEAYADIIESAVLTVTGELIYNVKQGIPYFDTAFLSPIYLATWASNVQKRIREFSFVKDITSFDYEFDASESRVSYQATILTDEGTVTVSV